MGVQAPPIKAFGEQVPGPGADSLPEKGKGKLRKPITPRDRNPAHSPWLPAPPLGAPNPKHMLCVFVGMKSHQGHF